MLKSLYINNFALIDEISIDFDEGFNVFTGETGAGKSIIIEAISFLLRGKADLSVVKTNADKAIIEGVFHLGENDEEMRRM
ncbi:MAG: AAA family ATPase, partial [Erysipelotrichaceae bacterium]|nr:AAA family ATPase [Erysipelotrichaceae bacterium]